jgi:hypothetical protein
LGFFQEMKMKIDPKKKRKQTSEGQTKKNYYCGQKVATYPRFQFFY